MQSAPIHLPLVRRLFARPSRLQEAEFLRREIADRMAEKLDLIKIDAKHIVDAGCGEGSDLPRLMTRFPQAKSIMGMDASWQALMRSEFFDAQIKSSQNSLFQRLFHLKSSNSASVNLLCGDFAAMPLAPNNVDVLWSNLALHWHPQPDQVLREWFRVLARNGIVMFSSFGPDTFIELKQAFSRVDAFPHTLPFVDMHDFGDMLVAAGFATPVMDVERITLRYQDARQLLKDVRALGGNPLATRRQALLGKTAFARLLSELEQMRGSDGRIPLTIEVIFGHAFKPVPTKLASGESIIRFDFPKK
ncbi:methyltransferase domain-containing protein [Undibacterium flavidum]|uniref:Malonyl-[acyl-carrier protein] O-methyltransferase n=1 Tax=Undibacterium flavidum TaxID=2762297 RepID=A0ABR6YAU9_9BURK|nr:methyltransferase domain-containing protein [Undibacterium flavidum]MBC3873704.1 methyltransferase domain-containing protein [Undibacterium flavidum]